LKTAELPELSATQERSLEMTSSDYLELALYSLSFFGGMVVYCLKDRGDGWYFGIVMFFISAGMLRERHPATDVEIVRAFSLLFIGMIFAYLFSGTLRKMHPIEYLKHRLHWRSHRW
jgi:hypothetical protein